MVAKSFECWLCGQTVPGGYHVYVLARSGREKDSFRDVCEQCLATRLYPTDEGYVVGEPRKQADPQTYVGESPLAHLGAKRPSEGDVGVGQAVGADEEDGWFLLSEAVRVLPDNVRHGLYEPFWERCIRELRRHGYND